MSYDYSHRVWETSLKGGKLLLMLALAHHANAEGICWPGMPALAEKARLTDRQVRRLLNELEKDGYITIEERAIGRGKKPHYQLFPSEKADISSSFGNDKPEEMSAFNAGKEEEMSAINHDNGEEKRTFLAEKADILPQNQSHARSLTPITPPSRGVGSSSSNKKRKSASPKLDSAQQIAFELLVDSEVGVLHRVATELARTLPAVDIYRAVDKWLPDHHDRDIGTGALVSRLNGLAENPRSVNAPNVSLSAGFRKSDLFHRHRLPDEMIPDGRKRYNIAPIEEPRRKYSR